MNLKVFFNLNGFMILGGSSVFSECQVLSLACAYMHLYARTHMYNDI